MDRVEQGLRLARGGLASMVLLLATLAAAQDAGTDAGTDAGEPKAGRAGTLSFRGFSHEQPLRLWSASDGGEVSHPFVVDEVSNAPVDKVQLRATDFRDEAGTSVFPATLVGTNAQSLDALTLGAQQSVSVTLKATPPQAGTYRSTLMLFYDGTPKGSAEVVLTRPRGALNVEVAETAIKVHGRASIRADESKVLIPLTLRETAGQPVSLYPPSLMKLTYKREEKDTALAFNTPAQVTVLTDAKRTPEGSIVLDRRQAIPIQVQVSQLPGAGLYQGSLQIASPEAPPIEATFSIYLQEPFSVVLVLIMAGVFVSFGIRFYQTSERPRLLLEHRSLVVAQSLVDLESSPECYGECMELVATLRQEVTKNHAEVSGWRVLLSPEATASKLEMLERKVTAARNWSRVRQAVLKVGSKRFLEEPLKKLAKVKKDLSGTATALEVMKAVEETLEKLPDELAEAVRKHVSEGIERLQEQVKSFKEGSPTSSGAHTFKARVESSLKLAHEQLGNDFQSALKSFDDARAAYAAVLADELSTRLKGKSPDFVPPPEWDELKSEVERHLGPVLKDQVPDAEAAVAAYEGGVKTFLGKVLPALTEHVKNALEATPPPPAPEALVKVRTQAQEAMKLLTEAKPAEALSKYEVASGDYEKSRRSAEAGGVMGTGAQPASSAAPPSLTLDGLPAHLAESVRLFSSPRLEVRTPAESMARIGRQLLLADLATLILMLLVASLVGLRILWVGDLTWGGWSDWLIAFLWGFGLHQIAYPGLTPLIERILTPSGTQVPPAQPAAPAAPGTPPTRP